MAAAGAPAVYAGVPTRGSCLAGEHGAITFTVDPTTRSGTYHETSPSCSSVAVFAGGFCDNFLLCNGECEVFPDGSATCWFGSASPSESSPNYMHLDAAGRLVGFTYGHKYLDAMLSRVA